VIRQVDDLLEPYGGLGAYGREDQMSDRFISDELKQLRVMSFFPPSIFLSIAAYLLNVSLSRLMSLQRPQIAVLKSFGYGSWEVGAHYAKMAAVLIGLGTIGGMLLGGWMGRVMTAMYREFYRFPGSLYHADPALFALAAGITAVAAFAGVAGSVSSAVSIPGHGDAAGTARRLSPFPDGSLGPVPEALAAHAHADPGIGTPSPPRSPGDFGNRVRLIWPDHGELWQGFDLLHHRRPIRSEPALRRGGHLSPAGAAPGGSPISRPFRG